MSLTDLSIPTSCLIDDALIERAADGPRLRQRDPPPTLADSEVLTVEVVGAVLGLAPDTETFRHFRRHHA